MSDPNALPPEQRRQAAEILYAQTRTWLEDPDSDPESDPDSTVGVSVRRGIDSRLNVVSGDRELHPNGTATVVLESNGGARHSTGPDVVPVPAMGGPPYSGGGSRSG
jgi:hypothetical protein